MKPPQATHMEMKHSFLLLWDPLHSDLSLYFLPIQAQKFNADRGNSAGSTWLIALLVIWSALPSPGDKNSLAHLRNSLYPLLLEELGQETNQEFIPTIMPKLLLLILKKSFSLSYCAYHKIYARLFGGTQKPTVDFLSILPLIWERY